MIVLALNLLLALLWSALVGSASVADFVVGLVVGYGVLWLARPLLGASRYFEKLPLALRFLGFFTIELVLANVRVAWDVISPRPRRRPGVVAVPLDAASDAEITLLAHFVTLTPGSVSLDVGEDRRTLYVHAMFVDDVEGLRAEIKHGLERRVLELLR